MLISTMSRRRLGALATACLLSVALPSGAAWAQKSKTKEAPAAETSVETPTAVSEFSVSIPTIDAVDSNVDDATLKEIFAGNVLDNADALAGLTATSITVPEISIEATSTLDGETTSLSYTMTDLVFSDVTDGVAASVTVASSSFDMGEAAAGAYDAFTMTDFDIGALLNVLGLADNGNADAFQTIYTDVKMDGGTITYPEVDCTFGPATAGEFKARPFKYTVPEMAALFSTLSETETPPPETIGKLLRIYADLLTAFDSAPIEYAGLDCSGTDDEGNALKVAVGGFTMGEWKPGVYPSFSVQDIGISVEGDGSVSLGSATFKSMDLSGPVAAIENAPEALDEAWFTANARSLIPAFEGFSFADLDLDVPDPETEGGRIVASIADFDLTLGEYLNGIPTDILTTANNIVLDLPANSADPQLQQLMALGVTSIDAGFTIDASWNEAENTIAVDEVSVTGANLATVVLAGTIANATEALFAVDENEMMAAAMGIAIANLKLDVTDAGLSDIILATVAAEQGSDAATMRPVFAGLAEGTIVGMLAGAAEAQKVGAAVNSFVSGKAKQLTIELAAKTEQGLGLMDFMAAETDPTTLIGKVNITATAK